VVVLAVYAYYEKNESARTESEAVDGPLHESGFGRFDGGGGGGEA
jgi:hypothetical protein